MRRLLLTNGHLIDGTGTPHYYVMSILIEEGRFKRIYRGVGEAPESLEINATIDLDGSYLLPGLWEAHCHLASAGSSLEDAGWSSLHEVPANRIVRCGHIAMRALKYGITSVRVAGEADYADIAWKQAFDNDMFIGPRLFVCGRPIIATGGHTWQKGWAVEVDGQAAVRKAVREQIARGADQIKLMLTGGVAAGLKVMDELQMTVDEIRAAVEVARLRGRKVCAHVGGSTAAKAAVRAGIASIEHGYILDDHAILMMADHGTFYVPTLAVTQGSGYIRAKSTSSTAAEMHKIADLHAETFQKALQAGVKIAAGDDLRPFPEQLFCELEYMVKLGMSPMDTIQAATRNTAALCDSDDRLGTIEQGKVADAIVVARDPLSDIAHLRDIVLVIKDGRVVADRR